MRLLRWRRVALTAAALAALVAACLWAPVFAHQRELHEQSRLEHLEAARKLDAVGLWPCFKRWDDWAFAEGKSTEGADLVMTASPAFGAPWRVSLTGNQVRFQRLQGYRSGISPLSKVPRYVGAPPTPTPRTYFREAEGVVDPDRARRIRELFARYVPNPPAELVMGADGVSYQIEMNGKCAQAWSADSANGANRLVGIVNLLGYRAARGAAVDDVRSERAIDILLDSFEHGDGEALVDYVASHGPVDEFRRPETVLFYAPD
jgi:hypothetical protein